MDELKTLRIKNTPGAKGFDQLVDDLREQSVPGENEVAINGIRRITKAKRPMAIEGYLDRARETLEGTKPNVVAVHPDVAAPMLGYDSGSHLLHDIENALKAYDLIHAETNRRMEANHPEIHDDTNLPEAAIRAVNNEERGKLLRKQLEHFYTKEFAAAKGLTGRIAGRIPRTEEIKEDVARDIGTKNFKQLSPQLYLQGMNLAQTEAERAMKAGELQQMVDHKRAELRNFEMYRAAQKAKDTINKRIDKVDGYSKKSVQEMSW